MIKKFRKPALSAVLSFILMFTSVQWGGILAAARDVKAAETKAEETKKRKRSH